MTVSLPITKEVTFASPGATLVFALPVSLRFFVDGDLVVKFYDPILLTYSAPLVLGADYTIQGANTTNSTLTLLSTAPAGKDVYVVRELLMTQSVDFTNLGAFYPELHEDALDRLTVFASDTVGPPGPTGPTGPSGPAGSAPITGATLNNYVRVGAGGDTLVERTPAQAKSDLGMGSVDNTSDSAKPVSTAQQTALDLKADKSPVLVQKNTAYTFVAADNNKIYYTDDATGTIAWTVNNAVHGAGNIISGYNDKSTSGSITLTQGAGLTLQWGTSTGTRTIARGGSFTLVFKTAGKVYLTGSGIT